jgi:hypothetical protein
VLCCVLFCSVLFLVYRNPLWKSALSWFLLILQYTWPSLYTITLGLKESFGTLRWYLRTLTYWISCLRNLHRRDTAVYETIILKLILEKLMWLSVLNSAGTAALLDTVQNVGFGERQAILEENRVYQVNMKNPNHVRVKFSLCLITTPRRGIGKRRCKSTQS